MIYQTGTIATTAGQTKIKGTGTRWKDNLAGISEGCPISYLINNVVYMNTVLSVNSDTEINLTYPVPVAAAAAKYQIATFVLDSMSDGVRKMLANQQYIGYFLRNMDTWLTQDGIVEVKTPTGETVRLDSLIELKKQIDGKLNKTGGTITKNSDALNLRNTSENQALFLGFQKMDGKRRGYIGAPNDKDRLAFVNDIAGTALVLTEDGKLTWQGRDLAALNRVTGEARAAASWFAGQSGAGATFIKLCTIGAGDGSSGAQRYQIFVTNTSSTGYSSAGTGSEEPQHFGILNLTIGNGTKPEKNILGSYFCTSHFDIASATIAPVLIKQINAYKAEIWLRGAPYTNYTCLANTQGDIEISQHVSDQTLVPVNDGVKSSYYISNVRILATANKYGNVEARDTMKVTASGNYPRVTLARADDTYVSLEADVPSNGNMANLIHRNQSNANIAVIAFPNRSGTAMLAGDFGWGGRGEGVAQNWTNASIEQHFKANQSTIWRTEASNDYAYRYGTNVMMKAGDTFGNISISHDSGNVWIVSGLYANTSSYKANKLWGSANTTVDTQGNIKKASPVIKLFADSIDPNEEAEGVEMEHLGVGHYLIKGVIGFNADGAWGVNNGFVIPQDHNGKNMVLIDYEVRPDGDIEVFVFHQQNAEMPERFQNKRIKYFDEEGKPIYFENYEPCDVPESRWIDMRVEMPPNSLYNQKLAEAERFAKLEAERLAKIEAERVAQEEEAERVAKEEAEKAARDEVERLEEESKQEQASKLEE
ncbi:TPA: MAP7 domain-containing protein [Providencia alcalifaciens]